VLADTHCHLNFESFEPDRFAVLKRAEEAEVVRILNPGVDLDSSRSAVALAEEFPSVFAAVGVHPNEAEAWTQHTLVELDELIRSKKVVAIGEIGLDYYWDSTPRVVQRRIFELQLDLAEKNALPVVVHVRDKDLDHHPALVDVLNILGQWINTLKHKNQELHSRPGVLHSFSGNVPAAEKAIDLGFWIGITGPVTFKKADTLKAVVKNAPAERLLTETDAPFLTPHPHRGKRNEPGYVYFVAQQIALLRNEGLERISEITTYNAKRLFHW
jgi:TatD DNase family protein